MIWTAWNNGKHHLSGAGYGFKIDAADRDRYFGRDWKTVAIELPTDRGVRNVVVNVAKSSFWNESCREVIAQDIGRWLLDEHHAPWPSGQPPKFEVRPHGVAHFRVGSRLKP